MTSLNRDEMKAAKNDTIKYRGKIDAILKSRHFHHEEKGNLYKWSS